MITRILFIALACLVLSGCGIFRKSKRSEKSLNKVEIDKDIQVSTEATVKETGRVEENTRAVTSSDGKTKVYPTLGAEVKIGPDGTITTKADSIKQDTRRQTEEARNIVGEVSKELQHKKDSVEKSAEQKESQKENKKSESKPSTWGIWSNWLGAGLAITIVITFLQWWFGIKRENKKGT